MEGEIESVRSSVNLTSTLSIFFTSDATQAKALGFSTESHSNYFLVISAPLAHHKQCSMELVARELLYAFPELQSCANPGGNKLGILCNAGLISHLKEAWKGKILHLEDMQVGRQWLHMQSEGLTFRLGV